MGRGSTDKVREAQPSSEPERQQLIVSVQSEREDRKWTIMVSRQKNSQTKTSWTLDLNIWCMWPEGSEWDFFSRPNKVEFFIYSATIANIYNKCFKLSVFILFKISMVLFLQLICEWGSEGRGLGVMCVCVCSCSHVCMNTNMHGGGSQEPKSSVYIGETVGWGATWRKTWSWINTQCG